MVRSYLVLAGMTAAGLGLISITNCGGNGGTGGSVSSGSAGSTAKSSATVGPTTTTSATTTSSSSGSFTPVEPPPPPGMMPTSGPTDVTLAISKLYLGDTDPDGTPDQTNGWAHFGYNIDGVNPNNLAKFCKTVNNASPMSVHQEGLNGIENSFGHNILQIILGIASDAATKINQSITSGKFTIMLDMQKLGTGTSYNPVLTQLFGGGNLGANAKFDGTDNWPVLPELLVDGMTVAGGSKVVFPMSYVAPDGMGGGTWVSGSKGMLTLDLSISGFSLSLNIANAVISMNLDSTHTHATGGVISGVLPTAQLTEQIQMVAGAFDPSLCTGPTIQSILAQIAQASDIMQDGTQDPTKQCNGISIGLGFDAAQVMNPTLVSPPAPCKVNPCDMDAGQCPDGG